MKTFSSAWKFCQAFFEAFMKTFSSMWTLGQVSRDASNVTTTQSDNQTNSTATRVVFGGAFLDSDGTPKGVLKDVPKDDVDISLLKKNGIEKFNKKFFGGALVDFDIAYKLEPKDTTILKYCAETKRALGLYQEALEDLNKVDEIEPDNLFTLATRGTVYKERKDYQNALKDLDRANELNGKHEFIKKQRGVVKRSLGDFEGALVDFEEANALKPNQPFVLAQLGVVMREMGNFNEALSYLNVAHELDSSDAFIYQQRGVVQRELKDLEGAVNDLNKANAIKPKDSYTLRRLGVTKRELLDYHGSLDDLNMANTLEPYNNFTLTERGVTKKLLGDFRGALEDLTMANHIKGDEAFTLKHRGSANRELGNPVDALHDLVTANELEPNNIFTLLELGMTKTLNNDYEGALNYYDDLLKMKPNDSLIFQQRGTLRRNLKDYKGALEDFDKAVELQAGSQSNTLAIIMERCFTKYAMKDEASSFEEAKLARNLLGAYDQSSIMGDSLKQATTKSERPLQNESSIFQRLDEIEESTLTRHLLWINHQNLLFKKKLGSGSYGYVHKCRWVHKNKDVAVKYVPTRMKGAFEYEVTMLAKIQHPLVVRLIGCSYDKEEKNGLVVMELMECSLYSLIEGKKEKNAFPFDLEVAVDLMKQIAEAMEYLHEHGVLHRDLKSSNVLINSCEKDEDGRERYVVKVADFGMAKLQGDNIMPYFMTVDVGTTLWRAPEVFKNEGCQKYSFPADVWSYGMTCFEILSGQEPFEGISRAQIRYNILCGLRPQLPASCPGFLQSLLMNCWSLMPQDRPTFSNINKALKLYLGAHTLRDCSEFRAGDVIRPHALRKFSF